MITRICAPLLLLVLLPQLSLPTAACIWDSDTLAMEAQAFPDLPQVIAGRFPRYPSLYYEMRLQRAAAHLKDKPENLPAYDDAATACDRLGRSDEAVQWMARKRARLEGADQSDPGVTEHWYRYHANLGTILAHHWLKNGADRARIAEMKQARNHIAKAIEINPDAHFGREKYQLLVMEWIIKPDQLLLGNYLAERLITNGSSLSASARGGGKRSERLGCSGQCLGERRCIRRVSTSFRTRRQRVA